MKGQNLFDTFGSLKLPVTNVTGPHRDVMSCRFLFSTATFHCHAIRYKFHTTTVRHIRLVSRKVSLAVRHEGRLSKLMHIDDHFVSSPSQPYLCKHSLNSRTLSTTERLPVFVTGNWPIFPGRSLLVRLGRQRPPQNAAEARFFTGRMPFPSPS